MSFDTNQTAESAGFEILGTQLGSDVELGLKTAIAGGVVFHNTGKPILIFREAIAASTCNIESRPMWRLFQEFLSKAPYEVAGEIPAELANSRISDSDTASVIAFIDLFLVNSFKFAIMELLAAPACLKLLEELQRDGELAVNARLYVGEAVSVHRAGGKGTYKGAPLYILIDERKTNRPLSITLAGVAEVASYSKSLRRLHEQLGRHIQEAERGLRVCGIEFPTEKVRVGYGSKRSVLRIGIQPSNSKLSRTFYTETSQRGTSLQVHPGTLPLNNDIIERTGNDAWMIKSKWSKESLAAAAYEMSFWYMEKVGEVIFSRGVPKDYSDMTPAQAGRNAAKVMLYHAILRCRTRREEQRAIALYNAYSFGYAMGMDARDPSGRLKILWPEDLA
jgi:hypothetical protein